ncbi:MAG TPA: integrase [Bacteroidales bacterium]|nr:integrase [Bacteroidales bacterium]
MQIRMSMLSYLQKAVPLRTLQYQAGHKHISSTERYNTTNTEELYKQLELFHPLR